MKSLYKYLISLLLTLTFFACDKDDDLHGVAVDDTQIPAINIVTPLIQDTLILGNSLKLKSSVIENDEIHHYGFWVRNKNTSKQYVSFMKHADLATANIDTTLNLPTLTTGTVLSVQVYATDHAGNENAKTVEVFVK